MREKAQCTRQYMSILSAFPTPHGAAREFFNSLLGSRGAGWFNHPAYSKPA
jgi:hypothetical protein